MEWPLYIKLSAMMFFQYGLWGAWMPVLAARLLGPLKMSGKQTGWIYATVPLGCIISPLIAGQLADQWVNSEWILVACHAIGAVLLYIAAKQNKFGPLFGVMMLYSLCYAATLPIVNSLMFAQLAQAFEGNKELIGAESGKIFIMAPIAWALVGYLLTGWRQFKGGAGDGSDCLKFAAILSVVMAACCVFLPATPPAGGEGLPIFKAIGMLQNPAFYIFLLISMLAIGLMQFYFLGTAQYMQDFGVQPKNVPAAMAVAQAAQALATWFLLGLCLKAIGFQWTLSIGVASWAVMYVMYVIGKPKWLIVAGQPLHGIAYVLFVIVGQIYVNAISTPDIVSSAQALVFAATMGIGLFLGTQFAGITMDRCSKDGRFEWRKIWAVSLVCMLVATLAMTTVFKDGTKTEQPDPNAPVEEIAAVAEVG